MQKSKEFTVSSTRKIEPQAKTGDPELGPLSDLPGKWKSLPGRGWNMIALPFAAGPHKYRLLCNQYDETLDFTLVDKGVPNRGIDIGGQTDQKVATLDYVQMITQIAADDSPQSGEAGPAGLAIHHEPGLWLHMQNLSSEGLDIARLGSVPHGDSLLALGSSDINDGGPNIPTISGLPHFVNQDLSNPYLDPYKHFHDNLFEGVFDPTIPNDLLVKGNNGVDFIQTRTLHVDTENATAGIHNIPFIVKQANATKMTFTMWISEVRENDGSKALRMQYSQVILLDFFPSPENPKQLIRWPHVSINTLVPA